MPDWLRFKAAPGSPNTLEQVARSIDCIEEKILDDGTVVIKRPDVYSQSRMTLYRKNFESALYNAINNFNEVLSARVFRSDQAAFLSQSNLAAAAATAKTSGSGRGSSTTNNTITPPALVPVGTGANAGTGVTPNGLAPNSIVRPNSLTALANPSTGAPFSLGFAGQPGPSQTAYGLGVEPVVYLNQLKTYQDHLNQLRRVNMGDDIADSAGYGLYLIRMPVSIQPGECTHKGYGAVLNATLRHDFGSNFLPTTFRNLVVNDLVDQLSPIVYELLRSDALSNLQGIKSPSDAIDAYRLNKDEDYQSYAIFKINKSSQDKLSSIVALYAPMTRINDRVFPIPGTEFDNVFIEQNIVMTALYAQQASRTSRPRATDIQAFLRREIEASYDLISQIYGENDPRSENIVSTYETLVPQIAEHVRTREYPELFKDYRNLASVIPGYRHYDPKTPKDPQAALIDIRVIMCYAIAVEAGLLDSQLRVDMKRVLGKDGADVSHLDAMRFFSPCPDRLAEQSFEEYVTKRWPIITFALDPVTDEQNIADSSSVVRDLQLALAFAFSTGQINFNQLTQYQRRVEVDSEAILLNRTVSAFAHGNDTFGFRFSPRYQNPPLEKSNFQAITNQLIKGSQGRNYRLKNSKLEPGQRELTAVVIMPSFLHGIQMDVTGNWFSLLDPDQMKTPSPRMIEQGRRVVELREALNCIHDHKTYRAGDIQRLRTRVNQLEAMLPMQTYEIAVPYENALGGFQLFQQGVSSLVPRLDGFQGVDVIDASQPGTDLLLFGKHFSVQETNVVVGGVYLSAQSLDVLGSNQTARQALAPPRRTRSPFPPASTRAGARSRPSRPRAGRRPPRITRRSTSSAARFSASVYPRMSRRLTSLTRIPRRRRSMSRSTLARLPASRTASSCRTSPWRRRRRPWHTRSTPKARP